MTTTPLASLLAEADARADAGDWQRAIERLEDILAQDREWAEMQGVPLQLARCRVEAAAEAGLEAIEPPGGRRRGSEREQHLIQRVRIRAVELCRAGDSRRASRLLRLLADYDDAIRGTLDDMLPSGSPAAAQPIVAGPSFLDDPTLSNAAVERAKQRFAGARVLIVYRQLFTDRPERCCDPVDNFDRSARRFGLTTQVVNSHYPPAGVDGAGYASWLQDQILSFRPQVILYDDLFETGVSAWNPEIADQLGAVLEGVRQHLGVRVVKSLLDAWYVQLCGQNRPFHGIGATVDLLHHLHPSLSWEQSAIERAVSFCYPMPFELPRPTVPWGTKARACFVGSISWASIARVVWRAEIGKRGLPFDFLESDHQAAVLRSDQDYANRFHEYQLSVNITRRSNGVRILLGRSIDIPLSEGVLLEEASPNSAYFLAPGIHYEPFTTLDELQGLIDDLLRSETRRRSLAREGNRWVTEHFTGDRFWAGLLARLFT